MKNSTEQKKVYLTKKKSYFIAFFFLILQLLIIWQNTPYYRYDVLFWFCNHVPLLFSITFLFRKINIIKSLINVGFLAQFVWALDFFSKLLFDAYIFRITQYVFTAEYNLLVLGTVMVHLLSTNIALYFTYKYKPNIKTLIYSMIYISILFIGTLIYALEDININCVHQICGLTQLTPPYYTYLWIIITFTIIVMPTQAIQYMLYKLYIKHKDNSITQLQNETIL